NNAGVTRDGLALRMSEADWDTVLDTNLKGAFLCCKAALRPMLRQRWGRIINISSVAGIAGNAGQANYSAAKAGLIGLTRALAREVAARGITVNAVAPGYIPSALWDSVPNAAKEALLQQIPLGRPGTPTEVAAAVGFFASSEAAYVTGQVLAVDGGLV
ncbi:MAG: SDR family oxidoreductase, partial [Chloroflexota bacterium]